MYLLFMLPTPEKERPKIPREKKDEIKDSWGVF